MRRYVAVLLLLTTTAAVSAVVYTAYATDRDFSRLIVAGDHALAADQSFAALESYSGAVGLRPDSMLAHLKRGTTYRRRGELELAAKDLRRATELDDTATLPLELLGDTELSLQRHDRAAQRYQTYVSLDDRSAQVWYKLGLALYRSGQSVRAIPALEQSLKLDRTLAESHLLLGLCRRDQGDSRQARAAFETAVQLSPGLVPARDALASLYTQGGMHTRAADQLEALAALDAGNPRRLVALGVAHARVRRHDAAVATLNRAIERFPEDVHAYAALGRTWLDEAELKADPSALDKALVALSRAAQAPDASSDALTTFGQALLLSGQSTAAERAFTLAVERLPVRTDAFVHLATLAERGRRPLDARDALVRYVSLVSDRERVAAVALRIARHSLDAGQTSVALEWINRAAREEGESAAVVRLRGEAAKRLRSRSPGVP